jgi:hypothetical protein
MAFTACHTMTSVLAQSTIRAPGEGEEEEEGGLCRRTKPRIYVQDLTGHRHGAMRHVQTPSLLPLYRSIHVGITNKAFGLPNGA